MAWKCARAAKSGGGDLYRSARWSRLAGELARFLQTDLLPHRSGLDRRTGAPGLCAIPDQLEQEPSRQPAELVAYDSLSKNFQVPDHRSQVNRRIDPWCHSLRHSVTPAVTTLHTASASGSAQKRFQNVPLSPPPLSHDALRR